MPADTYQGKEVVPNQAKFVVHDDHKETVANHDKETVPVAHFSEPFDEERGRKAAPIPTEHPLSQKPRPVNERLDRKIYGIRARWILLGFALLILLVLVLGVGLGVGLRSG